MRGVQVDRRRGGAVPGWVPVVIALALIAAFMFWLSATAEPTGGGDMVAQTTEVDSLAQQAAQVPAVDPMAFADNPRQYVGTEVRLQNVPVDSRLGLNSLWLKLPNQGLYLVRGTVTNTADINVTQRITVAGEVLPMTDSVVTAWIEEGSITEQEEMEARYATSYLDAWYIAPAQGAGAAAPGATGSDTSAAAQVGDTAAAAQEE